MAINPVMQEVCPSGRGSGVACGGDASRLAERAVRPLRLRLMGRHGVVVGWLPVVVVAGCGDFVHVGVGPLANGGDYVLQALAERVQADLPIAGPWHRRDHFVDDFLAAVMGERFEAGSHVFQFPTMIADGDTVALEWHVSARNAAGQPYKNDYRGIFVIRDSKIAAVCEYLYSRYAARVLLPELD